MVGPDKQLHPEPGDPLSPPPGHFVSPEHRSDLQRFLAEVKSLVEHRRGGPQEPGPPPPGT